MTIEVLGPAPETEIKDLIAQIEEEGNHYLHVPPVYGEWPKMTSGKLFAADWIKKFEEQIREVQRARKDADSGAVEQLVNSIVPAAWR